MFTLAISWLTTSNLPWFMDLTFQVPMHYCSVQHQTIHHQTYPQLGGISTSVHSLHSFWNYFSSNIWTPTDLGGSSFSVIPFCLFILFMGFSRQEYWSGLPFSSPVDHILSELSSMTRASWVTLHSMAHSFIELDKVVVHVISLVSFLWLWFSFCLSSEG